MAAIPVPSVNTPTYQTWGAAVAGKLNAITARTIAKTVAADGSVTITAAELGLATITGAACSVDFGTSAPALAVPQVSSASVLVRLYTINGTPALGFPSAGWTANVRIIAWSAGAAVTDDPELRPGDDERPEPNPQ